jgi:uncharacterized protein (DUF58 family)
MITLRGWWLLFLLGVMLVFGILSETPSLALISLTVLCWFLWSLLLFVVRLRLLGGQLYVVRQLYDDQGPMPSLWADRTYRVRTQLRSHSPFPSPFVRVTDRVPYGSERASGDIHANGSVQEGRPLEVSYMLYCPAAGRLRFEGLQVQVADLQGMFYRNLFIRDVEYYRVLPPFVDIKGQVPAVKRHNILPTMGHHRYRRAGSGSELLDLRDYIPGDPPKTIAWKVSARRDKLITKVFESEVPIRCTFFVDTSHSVRIGPIGDNALARLVEITAALTQASAGQRDLPGLCLFDQDRVRTYLKPARHSRHVIHVLNVLADVAGLAPTAEKVNPDKLLSLGYGLAEEVYPEALMQDVNHFPWWLTLFARDRSRKRSFPLFLLVSGAIALVIMFLFVRAFFPRLIYSFAPVSANLLILLILMFIGLIVLQRGLWNAITSFFARRGRHYRWRKKLAALLSVRFGLMPQGLGELLEDDGQFVKHLQRFLAEHQVPYALPLYSAKGEYLHTAPGKVDVLARALVGAVARGKDNELFVLLVDLLETEPLDAVLRAVKVALARHHQVIVLCPWPPGLPVPSREPAAEPEPLDLSGLDTGAGLKKFIERQTIARLHRAYFKVRRAFGRMGVMVHCAADQDSVKLILDRIKLMRSQLQGVR